DLLIIETRILMHPTIFSRRRYSIVCVCLFLPAILLGFDPGVWVPFPRAQVSAQDTKVVSDKTTAHHPLAVHPKNPRYFLFRDKPTILITSGEHYGAILNADFDYVRYLDELHAHGLNNTRTFVGSYREIPGSFGIGDNTLAPRPNRFFCPWA